METHSASVVLPILHPLHVDPAEVQEWYRLGASRIVDLSGVWKFETSWPSTPVVIQRMQHSDDFAPFAEIWKPSHQRFCDFYRFDLAAEVDINEYLRHLRSREIVFDSLDEDVACGFAEEITCSELAFSVGILILLMNVAYPGAVHTDRRFLFAGDRFLRSEEAFRGDFAVVVEHVKKLAWPPLASIDLIDVVRWYERIPGAESGTPAGASGRALAALSHILSGKGRRHSAEDLVWALVGLEAIYCDGTDGLKKQLMDRSELVLGPRSENKKRFGKMYDFRSRFVHGDLDFPLAFADPTWSWGDRVQQEAWDARSIAIGMLLASVQQLVKRDRHGFQFVLSLACG